MAMLEAGDVVRFHYLWTRQAAKGEESGRKARPVCVVVRTHLLSSSFADLIGESSTGIHACTRLADQVGE